MYFPHRSMSGRPPTSPTQYASHEPRTFASVPSIPTQKKSRRPRDTRKPPNTMVTSEGMGMQADSKIIRTRTA
jgi:hypothetical protein